MFNKRSIMKLENLPNEIFIHCFEYLNASDIFYAFEQLNPRFYRLIRTIPLRLNFQDIHKSIFDRFCEKMIDYTEIQQQIYSLKLSNEQTHGQIQAFFMCFSLVQFTQLRSLTLIEIQEQNVEQLSSLLPLLTQLTCIRLIHSVDAYDLFRYLPKCKLNTLSSQEIIPLTKLSVKFCMLNDIYRILQDMPLLQCLHISRCLQHESISSIDIHCLRERVNHLKHLVMSDCIMIKTDNLMDVIAYMINLRSLTVFVDGNSDIINASRWQQLITYSLPHLAVFRFRFGIFDRNEIVQKYYDFQSDFWIKEHQWYTECLLDDQTKSFILTVPYLNNKQPMTLKCVRHFNMLVDPSKTFNNVTNLWLQGEEVMISNNFYFPHITSLIIASLPKLVDESDEQKFIIALRRTMDMSHLKHLKLPLGCQVRRSRILLEIFKQASRLISLDIFKCAIDMLKSNKQICRYTSEMIRKLQYHRCFQHCIHDVSFNVNLVREIFPNIEQLICKVQEPVECLLLLNNLPKLSRLSVVFLYKNDLSPFNAMKEELSKLKNICFYENIQQRHGIIKMVTFGFWVDRDNMTS
ncbi:hypothetical protein I4U23_004321 [Adineta vaga]|nr:hypothetical protein I4U23_004321 [Adineta vaga]